MAGLIKHVKKWLGAGEPSSPLSLEFPRRKGKLEFAKHESDFFQTEMLSKSEKSSTMQKSFAMSSSSAHSTQGQLSRHGEQFSSLPLEMPQSDGALGDWTSPSFSIRELQRIHSEFVKTVKISVIRGLLDDLLQQQVFSTEDKDSVMENQGNKREKACCLIDMVTRKGETASQIMIDSLKKRDSHLCITLGLISPPAGVEHRDDKTVVKPTKQKRGNGGRKRKISESEEEVANEKSCTVDASGELQRIRSEFVKRVSDPVIKGLLDDLWQQKVFSAEEMESVMEKQITADRARCLIDRVMGKGETSSQIMIDSLKKMDPHLCITLGLISSPAGVGHRDDKTVVKPTKQKRDSNTETDSAGQALTNKQLLQVAKTLGKEWEQVAIHLDLKTKDLDDIKADRQMDVAMQKLKMLELWTRRRPPGKATAQDLLEGLKDMEDLPVETRLLLTDLMK